MAKMRTGFALELPEPPKTYEGSIEDWCADMRGAAEKDMSPRAFEGTVWDEIADRAGQRKLDQQAKKSKALATWRGGL